MLIDRCHYKLAAASPLQIDIKPGYEQALVVDFELDLTWSRLNDFGIEENQRHNYASLDDTVQLFKQVCMRVCVCVCMRMCMHLWVCVGDYTKKNYTVKYEIL